MNYQKTPHLASHVDEFYRMHRSLAERYDNVTGELRRNIPSDLQSQGSAISDMSSEPPPITASSPDHRLARSRSGSRAAGSDVFLKSVGSSSDFGTKGDESSMLDSESDSESDNSSVNNYSSASVNGEYREFRKKIMKSEADLLKFHIQQEENLRGSHRDCQEELRIAKEKIHKMRIKLQKYESMELRASGLSHENGSEGEYPEQEHEICGLDKELKVTREKLIDSEEEVKRLRRELEINGSSYNHLQEKLRSSQREISAWKSKFDREVSKMQDRISRYKASLSERDQEIRALREMVSNANKSLSEENSRLQEQIKKLWKERTFLDDNIKEMDLRRQCLEEDLRRVRIAKTEFEAKTVRLIAQMAKKDRCIDGLDREMRLKDERFEEMNRCMDGLRLGHEELVDGMENSRKLMEEFRCRGEELEREVEERGEEKREALRQLCVTVEHYRNRYQMLRQTFVGQNKRCMSIEKISNTVVSRYCANMIQQTN